MNKHYDGYLCRPKEQSSWFDIIEYGESSIKYFLEDGTLVHKFDCNNLPPSSRSGNVSVGRPAEPPPKRVIKQDVDWQNGKNMFMLSLITMLIILLFIK